MVSLRGIDVLCAGMYRACSTWQYEVAAHLVEEHRSGRRLGYLASGEYTALLRGDARARKRLERDQGARRRACDGPRALPAGPELSMFIATCATSFSR